MKSLQHFAAATLSAAALASAAAAQGSGFPQLPASPMALSGSLGACDKTTAAAGAGCSLSATSDYSYAQGVCANIGSAANKLACQSRITKNLLAAQKLCVSQARARDAICDTLGQAAYDPAIKPADFSTVINNPLFPLKPGDVRRYRSGSSLVTVTVTADTLVLAGVTCVVVHDVNRVDGVIEEDTLDYFAQHRDGSVWYFGEDTISYADGIASTDGSWRAGVDGAKGGIVMFGTPLLNRTNRLEFNLGDAEDMAKSLAINQHVVVPAGTFNNAFKTFEFTPIEPDLAEHKYYVPGIGNVLTVNLETGEKEALVSFTPGP
jgi:hypothetical protein